VRRQGVTVEPGSSAFLQVLAFYSPDGRYDDLYTSNYVTLNVLDRLKRLPGNDQRADLRRQGLRHAHLAEARPHAQLKLTPATSPRDQRAERAVRRRQGRPVADRRGQDLVYTITSKGRLSDRRSSRIIVRANPDGSTVRLRDVARVELGSRLRIQRPLQRQAGDADRHLPVSPAPTRSTSPGACKAASTNCSSASPRA
jgi:hypothetical protein